MEAGKPAAQSLDQVSSVRVAVVQQRDDLAAQVTKNLSQIQAYLLLSEIVIAEHAVQPQTVLPGTDGKTGNDGDTVFFEPVTNPWRLTHGSPGLFDRGGQQKTRFIDENQLGDQPLGVFLPSSSAWFSTPGSRPRRVPQPVGQASGGSTAVHA